VIIPAIGVFAPERIFVAVRAIAPVAGRPPNSGEKILAMPWPTSSTLGYVLVSAHAVGDDADMRDSIAPSMATVMAGEINGRSKSKWNRGI